MKDYIEYMDNITPDPALKAKILKQTRLKKSSAASSRTFLGYVGLVATAAVLLFGILVMPGALSNLRPPGGSDGYVINIVSSGISESDDVLESNDVPALVEPESDQEMDDMAGGYIPYPALVTPREQFIPNVGVGMLQPADHSWAAIPAYPGMAPWYRDDWRTYEGDNVVLDTPMDFPLRFTHELTDEQFSSVFPMLNHEFDASAMYTRDGLLIQVFAFGFRHCPYTYTHQTTQIYVAEGEHMFDQTFSSHNNTQVIYTHGVAVTVLDPSDISHDVHINQDRAMMAGFMLDNISYNVFVFCYLGETQALIDEVVSSLIEGGAADLSVLADPVIPELRNDMLTLEEARQDSVYGAFLPTYVPDGLELAIANRWICQHSNFLLLSWDGNMHANLRWMITKAGDHHSITAAQDIESSEENLHVPPFDGEENRARRAFAIPVFPIEDITVEMIESNSVWIDDSREGPGWWVFSFVVTYGDVVIEISSSRLSAQQLLDMLPCWESLVNQ